MSNLAKTALHTLHKELGARLVPFAGYEMPVQYPMGIIKENAHCRAQAGFFDISHMGQCFITGNDVVSELEKITPTKLSTLDINQQKYTVLTNENGGVMDDIMITRLSSKFLIVVNADCKQKDFNHLRSHLSEQCQVQELTAQALIALQGPAASEVMKKLCEPACQLTFMQAIETEINGMGCIISRSGYTGEDGFEISIANDNAEKLAKLLLSFEQVMPIGLGARDSLRLEAGLSLYGHELSDTITPVEAGLRWVLSGKEQYLGSVVIKDQLENGVAIKKIGLVVEGKIPVRENSEIFDISGNKVGIVTSGGFSPNLGKSIALALIDYDNNDDSFVTQIRKHTITLNKISLPFVKQRYHRN